MATSSSATSWLHTWDHSGRPVAPDPLWDQHGAFTTLKVERGIPLFQSHHRQRLGRTLRFLGIEPGPAHDQLWHHAYQCARTSGAEALLRVAYSADYYCLQLRPFSPPTSPINGRPAVISRRFPTWKTLYFSPILQALQPLDRGREELLMVTADGQLLEAATAGILLRSGQELIVPQGPLLPSITVQLLLEHLRPHYSSIQTRPVLLETLSEYDELILCGTGRETTPLYSIASHHWQARSSELAETCHALYTQLKQRYLRDALANGSS